MKNLYVAFLCILGMLWVPTQSQAKSFSSITGNTIGTDQTICNSTTPTALTGSIPGGGTGVYAYQWMVSSTSAIGGFTNIAGGTLQGYAPGSLTANRWYKRIVISGIERDTTSAVSITVTPVITAASNVITGTQTICFNTIPAILIGPTATGGNGTYVYQWQSSPDNVTFTNISGANSTTYNSPALTATTWFKRVVTSGGCTSTSASIQVTVTPVITTGSNTISVSQSICNGQTPLPFTGSTPTGAVGAFTYLWESSTVSASTGFSTAAGTSNGKNYTSPLALTQSTWYHRIAKSGGCSDTSSSILVTVVNTPPGNPAVYGNGVWNVYGYSDNAFGTYVGYYTEPSLSFKTTGRYASNQSPSYASGYQGCLIPVSNFSVSMKQTNFTPGTYQINLDSLDDYLKIFLNGTQIYSRTTCCVTSTISNIWTGTLGAADQMDLQWTGLPSPNYVGLSFVPVTPAPLVPGSIAQNLQVCYGEAPPSGFTNTAAPTSGCTLTGVQWQKSIDSVTWVPIVGATALTYTETSTLIQTTWYRRVATDACNNSIATTPVKVTVNVVPPGDPTVYGNNTWNVYVFQGTGTPGPFNAAVYKGYYTEPLLSFDSRNRWASTASPSNASNYQGCVVNVNNTWIDYKRTNFTPNIYQIDIPWHDDAVYLFVNGIQVFTHNGCCDAHTNVWTGPLSATDQVEMRVSQGGGPSYEILTLTPVIPPTLTSGAITPSQTICAGNVPPTPFTQSVAPTGGCTIKNYSWDYSTDNGATWTNISGANAISYTPTSSVYTQTLFRRTVYDVCGNSAIAVPDTVYMNNSAPGNPAVFGNNIWNVYCFQDINYSIYAGYYTEPLLTFQTTNRYPSTSPPSTASGYLGCQLINTYYSVSMKRTGFTAGLYQIDVTSDDDYNLIYINGVLVSSLTYPTIQNNVWTGNLGPTDQVEVRWRNNAGPGQTGVRFTIVTPTPLIPGTISAYNPNLCYNDLPIINEVTPASGGCFVNYTWQSSIDGGTTWVIVAGATGNSFTGTVSPTTNIQYRRVATDVCGTIAYSPPVTFTQTAGTVGNPAVYGNGVWNVYAYDAPAAAGSPFSAAQYLGYYVEPLLSFDSRNRWGNNNAPSDASGYQGCQVDQDNHWVSYRQTNFTPGTYQIDVATHDDDGYLFINGVQVWSHVGGCCDAHPNVWTGVLGASDKIEFRWREYYGGSNGALNFTLVTPSTSVIPGTIATSQTICANTVPAAFTSTTDATSTCYVSYQWQSSPDNITWTDISGATSNVYAPPAVASKTYFQRKATNSCGVTAISNVINVDVYPAVTSAGTIATDQTICSGTTPAAFTSTGLPTGGNGTYTYQWQSSLDNIGWSNIAGATAVTYAPATALTATTYYRRNTTSCGSPTGIASNVVKVTINATPVITTQPANPAACTGGSTTISVTASGVGLTYQWQVNTGSGFTNVTNVSPYSGATTATLTINPVIAGMAGYKYQVIVTGTCTPILTSNIVTLAVSNNAVITNQPANKTVCENSNAVFSVNASGTGITYQWQQNISAVWTNLSDNAVYSGTLTPTMTITGATVAMTGSIYRCVLNTTCPGLINSNQATLTVNAQPVNTIAADQTVCSGIAPNGLTGTAVGGYVWQSSIVSSSSGFVTASGTSNGQNYTPPVLSNTTYYQRIVTSGVCTNTSNVVTVTLNNTPIAITTQPTAQAVCAGGNASFTASATGPGTLTYVWYENGVALTDGGIYSGTQTNNLILTGVTAGMNNYSYLLKVFASGCSASSKNTTAVLLTTNNGPVVTTNQADFTTCQGSSVQLNIVATGIGLNYQWQIFSGGTWNNLSNFGSYSNVNGNSLRINPTTSAMDGSQYRCVVTGTCSPFTAYSTTTTMSVTSPVTNNSISNSQTLCAGTPAPFTGSTPTGGTGVYTYQWYINTTGTWFAIAGATGINYTSGPLTQTAQFYRAVSSGGCGPFNSPSITVTILPATSTTDPSNTTVCAGTNATFSVTGTGSGLSYQWQVNTGSGWNNIINGASYTGVTTATLTVVAPPFGFNNYQYRAIVGGGCIPLSVTSNPATLTVNPVALITSQPTNVNTCAGGNATYTIAASGTGLTYQWMEKVGAGAFVNISDGGIYSGTTTATLNLTGVNVGMNNNQYMCVITYGTCPISSLVASLTVNAQPVLVITNPPTTCAPSTVDITAAAVTAGSTLSGGTLTYWNNITFTSPVTNPTAIAVSGTYYIRVATSPVCYDIKPVVVNISPTILNNTVSAAQAICTGTAPSGLTGTAPSGGVGGYTYQWQMSTDNVTYSNIAGATNPNYSPGTLTVTTWYRRVVFSGTCTGTSAAIQITVVAYPTASISYSSPSFCANGTAPVTQTGQASGTYASTPSGLSLNSSTGAINLSGSAPNVYTVTYSFNNGTCSSTTTTSVTINALPTASINYVGTPFCATGTATVSRTGTAGGAYSAPAGLVIDGTTGDINLGTSSLGTYLVTYTFNNGTCTSSTNTSVTINALPTAAIFYPGSPFCATGNAVVSQSGPTGGTYSSTPSGLSINSATGAINLGASAVNNYTVTYSFTGGGCSNTTTANVVVNAQPTVLITNPAAVCSPSTVNLTLAAVTAGSTAGLTYTYYTDAAATTTLSTPSAVAASGTYYIKGTTATGCFDIKPVVVTINPKPTVVITNPAAICAPGTVDLTLAAVTTGSTAGLTYTYFTDAAGTLVLATPTAVATSGTYYIKGTTAAGCTDIKPVVVTINPKPTVVTNNPAAVCSPATVNLTLAAVTSGSTAGLTYTYFTDAAGTITLTTPAAVTTSGTYYIKGTTAAGCSDIKPVVVTINPKPTVVITNPAAVCAPGTVDLTAAAVTTGSTPGLTFTYFTNAAATTVLATPSAVAASGTYYIKGSTAAGCTDVQPVVVTINPKPTVKTVNPAAVCAPGTVDLTVAAVTAGSTAGLTFTYFTDAAGTIVLTTPASVTTSGTYYIQGTLATGCSDIKPVVVTINPKPTVVITNPAAVCSPGTVNLTAAAVTAGSTASLTYTYFTDAAATTTLAGPAAVAVSGTYYIKGTTAAGCFDIQPVVVTINPKPTVVITNPGAICSPGTVDLTDASITTGSTAGLTFTYFTNAAGTIVLATPSAVATGGTYYIKGTTGAGCTDIKPVVVTINPKPTVVITNPAAVCAPGTVNLTAATVTTGSTAGLTYTYFTDAAGTVVLATPSAVATSGTYYIKGTTAAGCSDMKPVVVTVNPKPTVVITNPAAVCAPGTVDLTAAAVTAGSTTGLTFTYFTNAAATIALASPSAVATSGTYYIKGTTAAGCSDVQPVVVTINPKPTVVITNPAAVCAPGTVDITAVAVTAGSTAGLTYTYFTDAAGTIALTTPSAVASGGTYYIKGTSASGCSDIKPVVVTINPKPTVVITNPAAVCSPSTVNLTVAAVTAGSTAGLTYTYFTDAAATTTLVGPAAVAVGGTYYIKGTTAAGCSDIKPVVVTINPKPTVVITNPAATCAPGTVDITVAGVTAGSTAGLTFTYFTNAAGTIVLATPSAVAASGTYYIKGTTAAGCSDIQPVIVTINPKPTVKTNNPAAVCSPSTVDLTIAAVTTGSTAGLTYTYFTDAAGTITLTTPSAVAVSGTYYIKGTTAAGCSDIQPVVVTINPKPTVVITNPAAVCAPGTVNLTAAAITAGSTAGLTFTYFTNAAGTIVLATPSAVAASGTYYIKGSTASGCSDIQPVVVTINPKPTVVITNPTAVCAPGTVDITAAAVTAGSTAGLTFAYFTDAAGTITLSTPSAVATSGTYYIQGTLPTGCSDIKPVVVTINPKPIVVITNPAAVCSPATVDLTLATVTTGSTAGLTYTYFTDAAGTIVLASPNAVATSGTYYIKGTTAAGCSDIKPVVVTINPKPTVVITNPPAVCAPGTVDITVAAVTAGSTAGLTYAYFTDAAGTLVLVSPNAVATSGTYYIKGTSAAGCSDIKPVVVTINPKPTVTITNPAAVCSPATADITVAAVTAGSTAGLAYTYFTDAAGTLVLASPNAIATSGTYYIKGTTASGCSDIKPVIVTINPKPTVAITNPSAVCTPGTVDITVPAVTAGSTAGLTFTYFTDAAATITLTTPSAIAASGTYYIKGTTASGCSDIKPVVVTVNPKPTVVITNPAAVCAPGTVDITAAGVTAGSTAGLTFTYFTNAAGTISLASPNAVATSGTYYIKGTTGSGCSDIQPVVVTINPKPTVIITNPAAVCAPGTVDITVAAVTAGSTAGLTYTYFTDAAGTISLSSPTAVAASGTYYIKGTTASGCSDINSVVVTINPKPTVVVTNPSAICSPGTVDLTAGSVTTGSTAGLTYTYFTDAAGTIVLTTPNAVATSGTYNIKGTTASGCSDIKPVVVTINPKPIVTITNPTAVCSPSTVDITIAAVTAGSTAGLTYTYYTDAAGVIVLGSPNAVTTSGTYYIKGTSVAGCSDIKPVVVTINPKPAIVITNPAASCTPGTIDITVAAVTAGSTAGLTYTYYTDAAGTIVLGSPNAVATSGTYYIKGTTASGCLDIKPVVVTINPKPTVVISNPSAVCAPGSVDLTAAAVTIGSTAGLTYTYFTDAAGTITLTSPNAVVTSGTYYIKGTSGSGCSDIKPVVVTINLLPVASIIYSGTPYCATGTATITQTGQTGGTYSSSPAGLSLNTGTGAVNLALSTPGLYSVTYTFSNGICSDSKTTPINIITAPSVVITNPAAACAPSTIDLTAPAVTSGSTSGLTYTYYTDAAGTTVLSSPNAVAAGGTYYIKGSAGSGCYDIKPVVVTINSKPTVVITNPAPVCPPNTIDLTLSAITSGSSAGLTYTYFIDAAGTNPLTTPTAITVAGTYYIRGTAATGCSDIKPVVVTFNTLPSASISYAGGPFCKVGSAVVTLTGTTGGFYTAPGAVSIDGTTGTIDLGASAPGGPYLITYTFSNGTCSNSTTASIVINALPTAAISYSGSPYCATGSAAVSQTGQSGGTYSATPAGLSIDPSTGAINLSASAVNNYTVTYSFNNGTCANSTTANISVLAKPTIVITNPAAVCSPATVDITVVAITTGSTAGLTYTYFTDAAGTITLTTPSAIAASGTYYIKGTTASGCSDIKPVVITINPKPTVVITNPAAVCAPGTVDITVAAVTAGSTAGLTYTYFTDAAGTIALATPSAVATGGTYYVKGSTASGCSDIKPVIVTINPKPAVVVTNPAAICAPGTVDITVSGVTTGSTAGLTYAYFTNAAGTVTLTSPNAVAISGTYYIKGTAASGCSDIQPVVVTINPKPTIVITNPAAVCTPATVDLTAAAVTAGSTAGLTYTYYTDAAGTIVLSSPGAVGTGGTYYIKGTTASGCSDIQAVAVSILTKPTLLITNPAAVCAPATVDLTTASITSGSSIGLIYTYFTDAVGTIALASPNAVATSGTYYIKGSTASGCSDIKPVVVTINPKPAVVTTNPAAVCAPGTVDITAAAITTGSTAGLTYAYFSDAAGTISLTTPSAVATSGTYYIKGSTAAGCSDIKPVVVTINPKPTIVITNPAAVCAPGTVDITVSSITSGSTVGLTYTYFTDAAGTTVLTTPSAIGTSGTYYIKGTTASGCSDIKPVVVTNNPKPTVAVTSPAAVCSPGTVDITVPAITTGSTAGLTYTYFTDAAGTISLTTPNAITVSGTYYIKGSTASGCSDIKPVVVTINPKPTVTITNPSAVCTPATVDITTAATTAGSTAGLTYTYFTDAAGTLVLASPNAIATSGTYYIKGTTAAGCSDIQPVVVSILSKPTIVITNPASVCSPSTVDITSASITAGSSVGLTYTYFTDAAGTVVLVNPTTVTTTGTYYIKGSTASGCSDIKPVVVTINPKPTVVITNPAAVCAPATVDITAGSVTTGSTAGLTYTYFTDAAATSALPSPSAVAVSGTYYIKGTTIAGCSDIKAVLVTINALPIANIAYNGTPFCATGTAIVTQTGQAGGTYTAPAAVSIDAITGSINLNASANGTYTITYTFTNGTCSNSTTASITINALPTAVISYSGSPYCGSGTAIVSQTGQTGGTYSASPAGLSLNTSTGDVDLGSSTPNTYIVTYNFGNGTCNNSTTATIKVLSQPLVVVTDPAAVCTPGTVDITAPSITAGSTSGLTYTYFKDAAGTISLATPTAVTVSGTYYIKGTTASGCSDIKPVTVSLLSKPTIVITNPSAVCSPSAVDITAASVTAGSSAGLTYAYFTDAAGTILLSTPGAVATSGTYYIKGSTASGCSDIQPVVVTINPKPTVVTNNPAAVCAPNTVDLTATPVTTGSTAGLTYTYYTDAAGTIILTTPNAVAASGTYYIKGTTAAGCSDIHSVAVTINPKPTVVITNPAAVCAPGTIDITATAVTSGSTAGLTYAYFTDAAATIVLTTPSAVAASGTYYIKGTTAAGCFDIQPVVVTINALPNASISYTGTPFCATGTATVTLTGQTGGVFTASPSGLIINSSTGDIDLLNSAPNSYTITYTFTNGTCGNTTNTNILINALPTASIAYNGTPYCATGIASVTQTGVAGGTYTAPAAVSIDPVTGAINLGATSAGIYIITYTFSNGTCSNSKTATITINALPNAVISYPGSPYCATGSASVTQTGQSGGTYSSSAGLVINSTTGLVDLSSSTPNNYTITYSFGNGTCTNSTTANINILPLPVVVATNPPAICAPSTVDLTAASVTAGSTAGLTYTYFTDAAGTLALSTPSAVATSGTYYIKGTTITGCTDIKPVVVTIYPKPTVVINNPSGVCSPATVDITTAAITAGSTAGLTYTYYSDAAGTIALTTPAAIATSGTYYIKGTSASGCIDIQPVVVVINALPLASISYAGTPYCASGTASVLQTGQGGGTYTSSPAGLSIDATSGDIDLQASTAGIYTITYTFSNGTCGSSTTTGVEVIALPVANISYDAIPYCATGTATVTQTGLTGGFYTAPAGVVIDGTTGSINLASSTPGTYTVTYTFSNGVCSNAKTASITINALPTASINYSGSPYCASGTASVTQTGQGGGTYSSTPGLVINTSTGLVNLATSTAGTYIVTYSFNNGTCSNSTTATIKVNALPVAAIAYTGTPYCTNGTAIVTLVGTGGGTFSSSPGLIINSSTGDINLTTSLQGHYVVTYNFNNGVCPGSTTTQLDIKNPNIVVNDPAGTCYPATIDLTNPAVTSGSQTGLTYSYYQDATGTIALANPNAVGISGNYFIKGTDLSTGCFTAIQPVLVTIFTKPTITASTSATDICKGTTVTLTAVSPGNTIDWVGIGSGNVVNVTPMDSTTYLAVATTTNGCMDTAYVDVAVKPFILTLTANPDPVLAGTNTTLTTSGNFTYNVLSWSPAQYFADQTATMQNVIAKDTTKSFTVIAQSTDGCMDTATLDIVVDPNLKDLFIPNSFSPNNDGNNDIFKVYGTSVKEITMRVYNQWGELIFESKNPSLGWDGTWKGRPQAVGVYVYVAQITFFNNVSIRRKGTVNLIR